MKKLNLFLIIFLLSFSLYGAYFENLETIVTQPNGKKLELLASGDEFYNWLHDENNYTIIRNSKTGYFSYAKKESGKIVATDWKVGEINPNSLGLEKNLKADAKFIKAKRDEFYSKMDTKTEKVTRGTLNNICILISFADQEEFETPRADFIEKFNNIDSGSISLRNYYKEVSYEQLDLPTTFFPESEPTTNISYQDEHERSYYMPYDAQTNPNGYQDYERVEREHMLLKSAIEAIADQVPEDLDIDRNDDGYVDNVCFVVRGPHTAWADLLWAHRWGLFSYDVYINDLQVYDYTFQPENQNTVRTLAHEMFHALGAPDLYHYNFDGLSPVGPWDIMEGSFVQMGTYMKYKYGGWLDSIPEITESGTYSVFPITSQNENCYKINLDGTNEFILVEYRKKDLDTFDRNIPGSGLVIYRINPNYSGNAEGPPDEVYAYREDGAYDENGWPNKSYFSLQAGRTAINDYTNPDAFLTYGSQSGLNLHSIGNAEDSSISFTVDFDSDNLPPNIEITNPVNEYFMQFGEITIETETDEPMRSIQQVNFYVNGELETTVESSPYEFDFVTTENDIGHYSIRAEIINDLGLSNYDQVNLNVINPNQEALLSYRSDEEYTDYFGRGSIPIKVAADFQIDSFYYIKKFSVHFEEDEIGENPSPGEFSAKLVEVDDDGNLTDNVIEDLGNFQSNLTGMQTFELNNPVQIFWMNFALVLDLGEYHRIAFDTNGRNGHSWLTEPDRPWTRASSRGMMGTAKIDIYVSNNSNNSTNEVPSNSLSLKTYPNPFSPSQNSRISQSKIEFSISEDSNTEISIYNVKGQRIKRFKNFYKAGNHIINWSGKNESDKLVSSGVYFIKLETKNQTKTEKILILK